MDKVLKGAIILSIVGILLLFVLSQNISIPKRDICSVGILDEDAMVQVEGKISLLYTTNTSTTLYLDKCFEIRVFAFEKIDLKINESVTVIGKVQFYDNKTSILADRISV